LALDESKKKDVVMEEDEITFLFDQKTSTLVGDLVIDFDDVDGFVIYDEAVGRSDC
jgi:Fe-S cluster assembly iron-binding protein IscA